MCGVWPPAAHLFGSDHAWFRGDRQPYDKPKAVLCICFAPDGDTLTGDSSGNIYVWGPPVPSHTITNAIPKAHEVGFTRRDVLLCVPGQNVAFTSP